jgi:hypothetical protein
VTSLRIPPVLLARADALVLHAGDGELVGASRSLVLRLTLAEGLRDSRGGTARSDAPSVAPSTPRRYLVSSPSDFMGEPSSWLTAGLRSGATAAGAEGASIAPAGAGGGGLLFLPL